MVDKDDVEAALEEARKARQEAENYRREARQEIERLKEEAKRVRDDARRMRDQARNEARDERHRGPRSHPGRPPGTPSGFHFGSEDRDDGSPGVRTEQSFSVDGVTHVQVNQSAGKLTVRQCKEGETPGISAAGNKATPELIVQREGSRLIVEIKLQKGWLFRRRQGATTTLRLGNQAFEQLRIDNGYGETEVQGMEANELRVHVGAGAIQCILTRGSIEVDVGAGKVQVLSHSGLARCDSGTGDVLLDIAEIAAGEYKVDVGLGRAEVRLPADAQVNIRAASGIGKSRIEYPSAPDNAPTKLRLNSGIGECVVKARDASVGPEPVKPAGQPRPQRSGRAATTARRREGEEMRVLQMLEQGKITPQDAADLIAALQGSSTPQFEDEGDDEPPVPLTL